MYTLPFGDAGAEDVLPISALLHQERRPNPRGQL